MCEPSVRANMGRPECAPKVIILVAVGAMDDHNAAMGFSHVRSDASSYQTRHQARVEGTGRVLVGDTKFSFGLATFPLFRAAVPHHTTLQTHGETCVQLVGHWRALSGCSANVRVWALAGAPKDLPDGHFPGNLRHHLVTVQLDRVRVFLGPITAGLEAPAELSDFLGDNKLLLLEKICLQ